MPSKFIATLIPSLFALAVAAPAQAQSSVVTVAGRIDLNVGRDIGSDTRRMGSGAMSQLSFGGVEDLGDGLQASFQLNTRINADDGTTNAPGAFLNSPAGTFWSQASWVGLGGRWGTLKLGRHMTAALLPQILVDPWFWDNTTSGFTATTGLVGNLWYNNSATYELNAGAFSLAAQVATKEGNPGWSGAARETPYSLALGWSPGPWELRVGFEKPADGRSRWTTLFGAWRFDALTVNAMLGQGRDTAGARVETWAASTVVPLGVGQLRAAYGHHERDRVVGSRKASLGYYHFLSKRTAVYANLAHDREVARRGSGHELGLQHRF